MTFKYCLTFYNFLATTTKANLGYFSLSLNLIDW